jgi:ferritin
MQNNTTINDLNKQINMELLASHVYLQASIWCAVNNYKGFAEYFLNASNEERGHAMLVKNYALDYVAAFGGFLQIESITEKASFSSLLDIVMQAGNLEAKVTESIKQNIINAQQANDFATVHFFYPMISEQIKSMAEIDYIINKMNECDSNYAAIMELDEEVSELK